jgi:hypothetical protein
MRQTADKFILSHLPRRIKDIKVNFLTGEVTVEYEPQVPGKGFPYYEEEELIFIGFNDEDR